MAALVGNSKSTLGCRLHANERPQIRAVGSCGLTTGTIDAGKFTTGAKPKKGKSPYKGKRGGYKRRRGTVALVRGK